MPLACTFVLFRLLMIRQRRPSRKTEFKQMYNDNMFFSDSTTVLLQIKSSSIKFQPFVKNKIIDIQDLHAAKAWHYIPSNCNMCVDLMLKGCKAEKTGKIETSEQNTADTDSEKMCQVQTIETKYWL